MAKTAGEMIGRPEIKIDPREGQTQEEAQKALEPYLVPIFEMLNVWLRNARGVQSFSVMEGIAQLIQQIQGVEFADKTLNFAALAS